MPDLADVEALVRVEFERRCFEPDRPPTGFRFARSVFGPRSVELVHALVGPRATTFTIGGKTKVAISRALPPPYRNHAAAHETMHGLFRREGWVFETEQAEELAADFGAACVLMPREVVRLGEREHGPRAARLMAKALCVTQFAWHLRRGEVAGEPTAAVSREAIRYRGQLEFNWGGDARVRELARARRLGPGVRKAVPTDQRDRAILVADPDVIAG